MNKRMARVSGLVQAEIANIILNELKDPRIGFVTVTEVEVAPDLRDAQVKVSVMGTAEEKKSTMIALERSKGFIQYRVNEAIRLKFTPKLHFKLDDSLDQGFALDQVIKKIHNEEEKSDE